MEGDEGVFRFSNGHVITFKTYNTLTGNSLLPLAYLTQAKDFWSNQDSKEKFFNVLSQANLNLSVDQKELLGWHFKLGHFNVAWIQRLTKPTRDGKTPLIPYCANSAPHCDAPLCAACRFAKATALSVDTLTITHDKAKRDSLKKETL